MHTALENLNHAQWFEYQTPLNRKHRDVLPNIDTEDTQETYDTQLFQDPLFPMQWYLVNTQIQN